MEIQQFKAKLIRPEAKGAWTYRGSLLLHGLQTVNG
jgi:hypothetical protein